MKKCIENINLNFDKLTTQIYIRFLKMIHTKRKEINNQLVFNIEN